MEWKDIVQYVVGLLGAGGGGLVLVSWLKSQFDGSSKWRAFGAKLEMWQKVKDHPELGPALLESVKAAMPKPKPAKAEKQPVKDRKDNNVLNVPGFRGHARFFLIYMFLLGGSGVMNTIWPSPLNIGIMTGTIVLTVYLAYKVARRAQETAELVGRGIVAIQYWQREFYEGQLVFYFLLDFVKQNDHEEALKSFPPTWKKGEAATKALERLDQPDKRVLVDGRELPPD